MIRSGSYWDGLQTSCHWSASFVVRPPAGIGGLIQTPIPAPSVPLEERIGTVEAARRWFPLPSTYMARFATSADARPISEKRPQKLPEGGLGSPSQRNTPPLAAEPTPTYNTPSTSFQLRM